MPRSLAGELGKGRWEREFGRTAWMAWEVEGDRLVAWKWTQSRRWKESQMASCLGYWRSVCSCMSTALSRISRWRGWRRCPLIFAQCGCGCIRIKLVYTIDMFSNNLVSWPPNKIDAAGCRILVDDSAIASCHCQACVPKVYYHFTLHDHIFIFSNAVGIGIRYLDF